MYKLSIGVVAFLGSIAGAAPTKQPTLTLETPTITGKLDAKLLTSTVRRTHKKLLGCYAKAFAKDKLIGPAVANATFTIGGDGKLSNLVVSAELPKGVDACIIGVLSTIRFKRKGADPVEVTYPLAFAPPTEGGAFASITGTGDISSGFDDTNIYGGLTGESPGGGGTGWGTIGVGTYGKIGSGSGTGQGYGVGGGRGGMRGRPAPVPTTSIGQPDAKGDLDKAIIRRYIKRNIQKLQYCYEKELLNQPKLEGTSTAAFTIGVDGLVTTSTASGLDANVDACIASVIQGIEFPKPKGGVVTVRYPLTFRPAETAPAKTP
ncbi:MAG: AgmX/PglI C-terminal domain-containing protein [Deltaproteobacteria bacterium]|nr:AgmX/PglI C-terminal domain-containing protein [Deltaproteobacteria bacterium]